MRICWISVSDRLGGSEVALVEMVRGLRAARPSWALHAILPGDGPLGARLEAAGASTEVVALPGALARVGESAAMRRRWSIGARVALGSQLARAAVVLPLYERRLGSALARFAPDVLHTNGFKAHVLGARLGGRSALVWHLHEYVSRRRLTRALLRRYAGRCRALVANSSSVASDAMEVFVAPPPVTVLHNAVDLQVFAPEGPVLDLDRLAGLAPDARAVRVGLVATFGRWKGQDVFIDALRRVVASSPVPVRGYIVGDSLYDTAGSQFTRAELQSLIVSAGLAGRVGLAGFLDAAPAMRSLDVVVHASREPEPFGLAIAEAMACGRAVVTTAHGGAAELVSPGADALVAEPGDAGALAEALLRLAIDPALRTELGARARSAALERFAPARMASRLASLYEEVAPEVRRYAPAS